MDKDKSKMLEFLKPLLKDDNDDLDINLNLAIPLTCSKKKKILSRKKLFFKKATLTRKKFSELGLYTIPRNQIKYEDVLPLNQLWKQYITEHLGLKQLQNVPNVEESKYENLSRLLLKADFHGAIVTVVRSKCPSLVDLEGIIILDTKMTFKIVGKDNKTRTIPKTDSVFSIKLKNFELTIFGKHLSIRPAERSVKKIKSIMDPDLC